MERSEFIKQVEETAQHCRSIGMNVEINESLPWVAVYLNPKDPTESTYFFQEEEASNLLDECPDDIHEEDYILWYAQGW